MKLVIDYAEESKCVVEGGVRQAKHRVARYL